MERPLRAPVTDAMDAITSLPLDQLEETSGELHRRAAVALRRIGEPLADDGGEGPPPRRRVAELAALIELTATTLASMAAGGDPPGIRIDRHPASAAAMMYAAPSIDALLHRLEQDRRLLTSFARHLESRLDHVGGTPWGTVSFRSILAQAAIIEPARCAQELERRVVEIEEAEIRRLAEAQRERGSRSGEADV